ncbi:hypothetical protein K523DRAFT_91527 [Schizophyllum commune Tattone D]|nr:hypothetical protein K523DRAFT_91527 [Schizophyllum commune Tattone D]
MCAYSGLKGKKRRQVVPFDYWIRGGNPRPAPKGDFGHSSPIYVRPGHCRYYAMGHCVHGMRCKYKHEQSGEPMSPPQWSTPPPSLPPSLPAYSPVAYPVTPPASCAVPLFDTMMTPPQMMTPASSISSMGSLTYSPSTATTVSEDMPWISDFDQHDDAGVAVASPVDEFGVRMPAPQPASKVRNMKYKTSPCMFFRSASGCSRGDMCTLLHPLGTFPRLDA